MVRASLDRYLKRHNLSAYRVAKETAGQVARGSVFALARGETVKRVDLETLSHVRNALERLTGQPVEIGDLLEIVPDPQPEADRATIEAAAAELAERLAELEKDVPPEQLRAFNEVAGEATPVAFDRERRMWLEGAEALAYRARAA